MKPTELECIELLRTASAAALTELNGPNLSLPRLIYIGERAGELKQRVLFASLARLAGEQPSLIEFIRGYARALMDFDNGQPEIVVSSPFEQNHRETAGVIANLIATSQESLLICTFVLMYIDELIPILTAACNRGVKVRILLDGSSKESFGSRTAEEKIVALHPSLLVRKWKGTDEQSTQHSKFICSDAREVLISSANLTGRALTQNLELGVISKDPQIIRGTIEFFEQIWDLSYSFVA